MHTIDKNFLSKILRSDGFLNTAIIRREKFLNDPLYKYVLDNTEWMNIFGQDIKWSDRFWVLYKDYHLLYCPTCNKPYISIPESQKVYSLCNHKRNYDKNKSALAMNNARKSLKSSFLQSLENENLILNDDEFSHQLDQYNLSHGLNFSEKHNGFFHDLVIKTKSIIPIDKNNLEFRKRLVIIRDNLKEIPRCPYCHRERRFLNSVHGFSKECNCHYEYWERKNNDLLKKLDSSKYEIISKSHLLANGIEIKCKKCGTITNIRVDDGRLLNAPDDYEWCKNCKPPSIPENNIFEFIKSFSKNAIHNTRKIISPKELDIYVPDKNIAIEFDGLYWHSKDSNRNFHLDKTNACEKKGIHLIHIFENEWDLKQDIVKSRLKNLFGIYDNKCYARQCKVRNVDSKTSGEFQEKNHIQGSVKSSINLGLYHNDELVSLMTFSKTRFSKKYEWELVRFCNKLGWHIPGAASKLLKFFEEKYRPKSIVSYADRRWTMNNGNTVYDKLGFKLNHISIPNYFYWKGYEFYSRVKFQKHKLSKMLESFDQSKSEVENMRANGYNRIFDCGNLVYVKEF